MVCRRVAVWLAVALFVMTIDRHKWLPVRIFPSNDVLRLLYYLGMAVSVCLSGYLPVLLFACRLSFCLSLFVCLSVCLSVRSPLSNRRGFCHL